MIFKLIYISKNFYISNKIRFRSINLLLSLNITSLYIRSFYYFVNILNFMNNKIKNCIKEKFQLYLADFISLILSEVFKSNNFDIFINELFLKKIYYLNYLYFTK